MERKFNKQPKLHVKSGDTVEVIAGNSKGKRGKIVEVLVKKNRVVVEGVNMIKNTSNLMHRILKAKSKN